MTPIRLAATAVRSCSWLVLRNPGVQAAVVYSWQQAACGCLGQLLVYSHAALPPGLCQTVFAATGTGGVYRSDTAGDSWSAVNHGLHDIFVNDLVISPAFPRDTTIFAASVQSGVFRSIDSGDSWQHAIRGLPNPLVWTIVLSPDFLNDGTLFVGTTTGVFRSTDGGDSWQGTAALPGNSNVQALALSPGYAEDTTLLASNLDGLFRSTDGGASWNQAGGGLAGMSVWAIAPSPRFSSDSTVFAGTNENGVYMSTDGADSWAQVNKGLGDTLVFAGTSAGVFRGADVQSAPTPSPGLATLSRSLSGLLGWGIVTVFALLAGVVVWWLRAKRAGRAGNSRPPRSRGRSKYRVRLDQQHAPREYRQR